MTRRSRRDEVEDDDRFDDESDDEWDDDGGRDEAPTSEEKTLALCAHLGGFVAGFLPALVIWLVKKDESPFLADQAKEALNFQITITVGSFVCVALAFVLIGFLLLPVLMIFAMVYPIIGALKANEGVRYRYPVTIRFVN